MPAKSTPSLFFRLHSMTFHVTHFPTSLITVSTQFLNYRQHLTRRHTLMNCILSHSATLNAWFSGAKVHGLPSPVSSALLPPRPALTLRMSMHTRHHPRTKQTPMRLRYSLHEAFAARIAEWTRAPRASCVVVLRQHAGVTYANWVSSQRNTMCLTENVAQRTHCMSPKNLPCSKGPVLPMILA